MIGVFFFFAEFKVRSTLALPRKDKNIARNKFSGIKPLNTSLSAQEDTAQGGVDGENSSDTDSVISHSTSLSDSDFEETPPEKIYKYQPVDVSTLLQVVARKRAYSVSDSEWYASFIC